MIWPCWPRNEGSSSCKWLSLPHRHPILTSSRDQDFKDIGPEKQLEFVRHYGRLHIHPVSSSV